MSEEPKWTQGEFWAQLAEARAALDRSSPGWKVEAKEILDVLISGGQRAAAPDMYEALRAAEWSGPSTFAGWPTCPWCRCPKPLKTHLTSGHASDCKWSATLAMADGKAKP